METKWIDISRDLLSAPVYPGDPAPETKPLCRVEWGDVCNTTAISACLHNGTHMDAPRHFLPEGASIDEIDPMAFIGECVVLQGEGLLLGDEAERLLPKLKSRVLFKGDIQLSPSAAFVLSDAGIKLLGVESPSVASAEYTTEVHRQLLTTGMVLLEGLDLTAAAPDTTYFLIAAPLKIAGADGAPVRAFLAKREQIDWEEPYWIR